MNKNRRRTRHRPDRRSAGRGRVPEPSRPPEPPPHPAPPDRTVGLGGLIPDVQPPIGVAYPQLLRGPNYAWWRSAFGVVAAISLYLLITPSVSSIVLDIGYLLEQPTRTRNEYAAAGGRFETPIGMLAQNLGIVALIPISWFLIWVLHQVRPRWLSSVQPRIRWRYLLICLGAALLILNAAALTTTLSGSNPGFRPQAQILGFLAVIILTSPFQAAAEEYLFRGYLLQAFGSLVINPWFGVVASSTLFALFHGGQNLPLFLNRLGFGFLAAVLVLKTGGLEAGIAAHIANNLTAYIVAGLTASIASLRAIRDITWIISAIDLGAFALFTVVAILIARRLQLQTITVGTPAPPS